MIMTLESYLQMHTMCTVAEQVVLATLFCEVLAILWGDENAKVSAFLCEMSLCGIYVATDVMFVMGPVMTGLTYAMIISFIIKVVIMAAHLPAAIRHCRLVNRCKRVCEQNRRVLSADDICRICQAYCRQVRQKNNTPDIRGLFNAAGF